MGSDATYVVKKQTGLAQTIVAEPVGEEALLDAVSDLVDLLDTGMVGAIVIEFGVAADPEEDDA